MKEPIPSQHPDPFETLLQESQERTLELERGQQIIDGIHAHVIANAQAYEVPFVKDGAGNFDPQMYDKIRETVIAEHPELREYVDTDEIEALALYKAHDIHASERLFLTMITLRSVDAIERPCTLNQLEALNVEKTQVIADWVLKRDLRLDSPWITFLNNTVPGDPISFEVIENEIINTIDTYRVREQQQFDDDFARVLARDAAGLNEILGRQPELEIALTVIALTAHMLDDTEYASMAFEQARMLGVDVSAIYAYVDTINKNL